jgi:hypothetical protein
LLAKPQRVFGKQQQTVGQTVERRGEERRTNRVEF